jgi:small subunit ribosomal protein S20
MRSHAGDDDPVCGIGMNLCIECGKTIDVRTQPGYEPFNDAAIGAARADFKISCCGLCSLATGFFRMANTPSAKKAVRVIERRTAVNRARRSRVRTFIRKVEDALKTGDHVVARDAFRAAEPQIMRAAQKGIMHKNAASRKVSRLSARVKALGTAAQA